MMTSLFVRPDFKKVYYRAEFLKWYQRRVLRKTFGIWWNKTPFHLPSFNKLEAATILDEAMQSDAPVMIARWGSTELDVVYESLKIANGLSSEITQKFLDRARFEAGLFPRQQDKYVCYAKTLVTAMMTCDILGAWMVKRTYPTEEYVIKTYAPHVKIMNLGDLPPFHYEKPWSRFLKGKKVAVVHPLVSSIVQQYKKRELLFKNPDILPDFELIPIKPVVSNVAEKVEHEDWGCALQSMQKKLDETDFDILIVGAGAYGMALAAHAKGLGKKAVHLGGATQLLFGIRGTRWDEAEGYYDSIGANLEHWVRPDASERPKMHKDLENACYW